VFPVRDGVYPREKDARRLSGNASPTVPEKTLGAADPVRPVFNAPRQHEDRSREDGRIDEIEKAPVAEVGSQGKTQSVDHGLRGIPGIGVELDRSRQNAAALDRGHEHEVGVALVAVLKRDPDVEENAVE